MDLTIGSTFADHEIIGVAGRGGMGVVYRARHLSLQREVALKVIASALSADDEFRARFRREAEVAASIQHPNVIAIHHAGEADGRLFVTMRFVDGPDLGAAVARDGPLAPLRAARVIDQLAGALDAAHGRGVVHRDVKPGNVLLVDGDAVLTDFGLTKRIDSPVSSARTLFGSVDYLAPEQIEGTPVDARTDVYALGAVLYFALTGQVPFPRADLDAKLHAHLTAPPPAVGDPRLDAVIARALAKAPADRYASAGALGRAIVAAAAHARPFVGRAGDLDRIAGRFALAAAGRRQFVLLTGEAGIGKSRLAREAAQRSAAGVLSGRSDADSLVPYQPFIVALGQYVAAREGFRLPAELEPERQELARLIPSLRGDAGPAATEDADTRRYRLFAAVAHALAFTARERPVVLVLDDLHWADASTIRLLEHLLDDAQPSRMLVLGTARDVAPPLSDLVAGRYEDFERIALTGLDAAETGELAGTEHGAAFARRLRERTDGNPFFIQETLRSLSEVASEDAFDRELQRMPVPESIEALIATRLARLSPAAAEVLTVASVIGREFELDIVAALVDAPVDALIAALEEATTAGLVRELPERVDRFAFAHALVRETLYARQSASRRIRLHHRIGLALEGDASPAELAHHFLASRHLDTEGRAVEYAVLAAEEATGALAYEEAVRHYRLAVDVGRTSALLLALGAAEWRAGDAASSETFLAAAALARSDGDPDRLAEAALGLSGKGVHGATIDERAIALLEEALDASQGPLEARLLASLANRLHFAGQFERVEALSRRSLALAQQTGDPESLVAALDSRHGALFHISDLDERLRLSQEMLDLARTVGDRDLEALGQHWWAYDLVEADDVDAARAAYRALVELAEALRQPMAWHYVTRWQVMWAQMEDRTEDADRLIEVAHDSAVRAQAREAEPEYVGQRLGLAYRYGVLGGLVTMLRDAGRRHPHLGLYRPVLALALLQAGQREAATAEFEALAADRYARVPRDGLWFASICLLAEVCALLEDRRQAPVLYELIQPYRDRNVMAGMVTCLGSAERYLGLLAAAMGDRPAAARHFELALARNAANGIVSMVRVIQDQ